MSGIADRLSAALSDCYRIERQLGEGGMATVYLAALAGLDRQGGGHVPEPVAGREEVRSGDTALAIRGRPR